jgi:hypothetical protein
MPPLHCAGKFIANSPSFAIATHHDSATSLFEEFIRTTRDQLDLQDNGPSCAIFCGVARYPVEIGYWKVRTPQAV